jgi:ribosomal protein S18 acetylase RimI-like enzyme
VVTLHPYDSNDLETITHLLARSLPRESISRARFTRQVLLDPNFRPEGALLAREDGAPAGFVLAMARQVPLENAPSDADRGYVTLLAVHPELRRRGVGTRLLDGAEEYLRSQARTSVLVSPYAPGYFTPGVDVACEDALAFFGARGFTEVYRPLAMETSLWTWSPPEWLAERERQLCASPSCVSFAPYDPCHTAALLEFTRREFPGDWVRVVRETMARILEGEPATRLIVARTLDGIVGFAHHDRERFGPIGVAASERGRGLGQVLMFRTLRAMRDQGYRTAWFLWSDDRTARRLYDAAGFREVRRFAVLRKELE